MKEETLNKAIKFLDDYKDYFQLDEDDVQDILILFIQNYNDDRGAVSTFIKTIISNHNISKWRKLSFPKHAHTSVPIDKITDDDDREWLMGRISQEEPLKFIEEEELQLKMDQINKLLPLLTEKQHYAITKYFFEEMTLREIGDKMGVSHQAIKHQIENGIKKIRKNL